MWVARSVVLLIWQRGKTNQDLLSFMFGLHVMIQCIRLAKSNTVRERRPKQNFRKYDIMN